MLESIAAGILIEVQTGFFKEIEKEFKATECVMRVAFQFMSKNYRLRCRCPFKTTGTNFRDGKSLRENDCDGGSV